MILNHSFVSLSAHSANTEIKLRGCGAGPTQRLVNTLKLRVTRRRTKCLFVAEPEFCRSSRTLRFWYNTVLPRPHKGVRTYRFMPLLENTQSSKTRRSTPLKPDEVHIIIHDKLWGKEESAHGLGSGGIWAAWRNSPAPPVCSWLTATLLNAPHNRLVVATPPEPGAIKV